MPRPDLRKRIPSALLLLSALLLGGRAAPLAAQIRVGSAAAADSAGPEKEPFFVERDLYVAGSFALATVALFPLDRALARESQDSTVQAVRVARGVARGLSTGGSAWGWLVASGAVYGAGRVARDSALAETGLHAAEAILVGDALTRVVKGIAGRARPFVDVDAPHAFALGRGFEDHDYQSFPSGHTAGSFAAASAITSEVSRHWPAATRIVAPVLYGTATLVGLSRMYDNKHWASDVAVGAAIGTFSGLKVVRQNHLNPGNRLDRWLASVRVLPAAGGGVGVAVRRAF